MGIYSLYYITGFLMIPIFIFALICQGKVKRNFKKYARIISQSGMTGADAAYRLLQLNGITDVKIQKISGSLTDHYNPATKTIGLSEEVFGARSVAAIGIACHEAGHACQHAQGYAALKLRNTVIPMTRIGSTFGVLICIGGMYISSMASMATFGQGIAYAGIILYSFVAIFQLLTLPVEFDASRRALSTIQQHAFLTEEEYKGARRVLSAAALTYVAALASALVTLLRLFLIINGGKRR